MIESRKIKIEIIQEYLDKVKECDCLVLGCTHYPSLKKYINDYLDIKIIDMGEVLSDSLNLVNNSKLEITLYFTKLSSNLLLNIDNIIAFKKKVEGVDLDEGN